MPKTKIPPKSKSYSKDRLIEITIFQTIHFDPEDLDLLRSGDDSKIMNSENIRMVAESQFEAAKEIEQNAEYQKIPIISEKKPDINYRLVLTKIKDDIKNFFPEEIRNRPASELYDSLFPHGLSNLSFEELSVDQIKLLVMGVEPYLIAKKIIDKTYSDHIENFKTLLPGEGYRFLEESLGSIQSQSREYYTLLQAKEIAEKTKSNRVIVIYGASHVFQDVAQECFTNDLKLIFKHKSVVEKYIDVDKMFADVNFFRLNPPVCNNPPLLSYEIRDYLKNNPKHANINKPIDNRQATPDKLFHVNNSTFLALFTVALSLILYYFARTKLRSIGPSNSIHNTSQVFSKKPKSKESQKYNKERALSK